MLPVSQEGLGPSKAGGPSGKGTVGVPGTRDMFSSFMLSTSRKKGLPEQKQPAQKGFPCHCPLPHPSLISLVHSWTVCSHGIPSALLLLLWALVNPLPTHCISLPSIYPCFLGRSLVLMLEAGRSGFRSYLCHFLVLMPHGTDLTSVPPVSSGEWKT